MTGTRDLENEAEQLARRLRTWTKEHDPHVRAAVELLIWRGWLRRRDFVGACVSDDFVHAREAWIDWPRARKFADTAQGSTSELAILDLAVALGEDRYRLYIMGDAHSKAIAAAVAMAVGEEYEPSWLGRTGQ